MRVLALTHRVPYPPDKGDKIRTHHLLTRLAAMAEVHLVAFAEPPDDARYEARLRAHFASVTTVPLHLRWQKLRAMAYLATATPLTLPVFDRRTMRASVDRRVHELRPDVIVAESTSMAPYALAHPTVPLVMDFVDVDSAKWRAYADRAGVATAMVYRREAWLLERYERTVARHARVSLVTADRERALLERIAPGCTLHTLANGVDTRYFAPRASTPTRESLVFFGAMDYAANVEAAQFLVRRVVPRVRCRRPELTVVLAGANPVPEVRALERERGTTVTGYVDDMRGWVTGASLCVVPLRVARGVQNKVLEAMAMGVPVVASPAAAEGIDATIGEAIEVAPVDDGGAAMARAIEALLDDRSRAEAMAQRARALVVERYAWEPRARELFGHCRTAMGHANDTSSTS